MTVGLYLLVLLTSGQVVLSSIAQVIDGNSDWELIVKERKPDVGYNADRGYEDTYLREYADNLEDLLRRVRKERYADKLRKLPTEDLISSDEMEKCLEDFASVFEDAANGKHYALKSAAAYSSIPVLDSWARPGSGVLEGNVRWPGRYYECWGSQGANISGQWCVTYMGDARPVEHPGIPLVMMWGSCFPSSCSQDSVAGIIGQLVTDEPLPPVLSTTCPPPVDGLNAIDVIAIVICSLLALFLVAGTSQSLFDKIYLRKGRSSKAHGSKLLRCFSLLENYALLTSLESPSNNLPVLDGIRVLSTTWVVLTHCFYMPMNMIDNAVASNAYYRGHGELQALGNGTFSVDSFFFLSGLLVAYILMKQIKKGKGFLNVPLIYLHRYLRLTPVYAFLLLFSMSLYKVMGSGPFWAELADKMYSSCKYNWFANLLYFNNLYPAQPQVCFGWSWYLANDMQFYLLAPLFLLVLYRWRRVGIGLLLSVLAANIVITGVLAKEAKLQPTSVGLSLLMSVFGRFMVDPDAEVTYTERYKSDLYTTPWCRIGVYVVGMLTGYFLYVKQNKIQMNKAVVIGGWLVASGSALALVYGVYPHVRDFTVLEEDLAAFYSAVSRPVWALCLAWLCVACIAGYGGPVTKVLNWRGFIPLSKLSYTAYLIHLLVVYWFMCTQETMFHFTVENTIYIYLGTLLLTYMLAFLVCICVEWPIMRATKIILAPLLTTRVDKKQDSSDGYQNPVVVSKL